MNLVQIGISHHTAPLEVRERMWLSEEEIKGALESLKVRNVGECVIVSTCNRTELYAMATGEENSASGLGDFLRGVKENNGVVLPSHLTTTSETDAIVHLFEVAAGIDSMVIGDIQILNQVKESFNIAREKGVIGPVLNRLLQAALHVGKRVRTETTICEGAVSVSYAAVELAGKIFADLSRKTALLIGAGETGELTLKHLVSKGVGQITITNRTREKAEALAAAFGARAVPLEELSAALLGADIVITSISGPSPALSAADLQKVMRLRSSMPLFIIDIGVPRNVDPSARRIDNVFLYDIDALSAIVDKNLEKRKAEIPRVHEIVHAETELFLNWYNALQVAPTITDFRDTLESIRAQEVEKHINRFAPGDRELVDLVTKRILNKILHQPTTVLKRSAEHPDNEETLVRINALRELFGIGRNGETKHE
jgi:glutamyl-tRNA reductase